MKVPRVFIQIVSWNSKETIVPCLRAALSQRGFSPGQNLFVSVYDNASTDGTRNEVLKHFPDEVELRLNSQNLGFASGHNQAFQRSLERGAEFVLVLNPDLALSPEALGALVQALQADPRAGVSCPKLVRAGPDLEPLFPPLLDAAGMYMTPEIRHLDRGSGEPDSQNFETPAYVFGASGACALYRRECLLDAALPRTNASAEEKTLAVYDDEFFAYREDADLSWRLLWLGWKTRYVPESLGYHVRKVVPERREHLPPEINSWSVRNRFLMQVNNLSLRAQGIQIICAIWRNALVLAAVLIREKASIPGLKQAFRLLPRALKRRHELFSRRRESALAIRRWFAFTGYAEPALPVKTNAAPEKIKNVHAVIISYQTKSEAEKCLLALREEGESFSFSLRISLFDNSPEGSEEAFSVSPASDIYFRRCPENLGFAGAINAALQEGDSEALLVLNPDIRLSLKDLQLLVQALEDYPTLGAVSPVLLSEDGTRQHGFIARRFPTLSSTLSELFLLHRLWPKNPWSRFYRLEDDPWVFQYFEGQEGFEDGPYESLSRPLLLDQPAGACLLLRSSIAKDLGGFDAGFYPAWFEDVDYCKRLKNSGAHAAVVGLAQAEHRGGVSKDMLTPETYARYWYKNLLRYFRKHGTPFEYALLRGAVPLALFLRAVAWGLLSVLARLRNGNGVSELETARAFLRLSGELIQP